jgi:hypothetical protein
MEATRGYLLCDAQQEKTLRSADAGLSPLEAQTQEQRRAAAASPERAIERAATQHHSIACLGSFLITVTLLNGGRHHEISLDRVERMGDLSAGKSRKFTFSRRYNPEKVSPFVTKY